MKLHYEYPGMRPRFPYLLFQESAGSYYKVLLRERFLFVSHGSKVIERDRGELDIPFVGAERRPIGDFVYEHAEEARAAFERFRDSPVESLAVVRTGRKP